MSQQTEFKINLEGIKLSEAARQRIETGIQSLVLHEIASFTPNPDAPDKTPVFPGGHKAGIVIVPMKWPGLWLRVLDQENVKSVLPTVKTTEIREF